MRRHASETTTGILSQGRNGTKACVRVVDHRGRPAVEKDYSGRGWLVRRWIGPWMLHREERALRILSDVPGVPAFLQRPERHRLLMERLEARPLKECSAGALPPDYFVLLSDLVRRIHARGVAQGDIGSSDALVLEDGSPALVDYSVAAFRRSPIIGPLLFKLAARNDRRRLRRLKRRFGQAPDEPPARGGFAAKPPAGLARNVLMLGFILALAWFGAPRPVDLWLGLPFLLAGAGVRTWAAGHLRKSRELALDGPYAHVRHPLYLGRLLLMTGFCLMARLPGGANLGLLAAGLLAFFLYYLPRKERVEGSRLEELHGDRWRAYSRAVPLIFPRVTAYRPPENGEARRPGSWRWQRFSRNREYLMLLLEAGIVLLLAARAF